MPSTCVIIIFVVGLFYVISAEPVPPTNTNVTEAPVCEVPCEIGDNKCALLQSCIKGCCGPAVINNIRIRVNSKTISIRGDFKMCKAQQKVVIAGAGLVGAMNACFFAAKGWQVEVYEARNDIRSMAHVAGRSINLALSRRGMASLEAIGLKDYIVHKGVEMHARLVHDIDGKTIHRQPYGQPGQHIVSINRRHLNEALIDEAEKYPTVKFFFQHKIVKLKSSNGKPGNGLTIENNLNNETFEVEADLLLACDGAYSAIRKSLMSFPLFQYSQQYIEHGYVELNVKPTKDGQFAMEPNVFHLWPRGDFTLIALANTDKTFTVTLFAPFQVFEEQMDTDAKLWQFFTHYFPEMAELLGRSDLIAAFYKSAPNQHERREALPLVSIKCQPHAFENRVLLMGDAAHAMVPFYGQGFEDCLVLSEILERFNNDIPKTLDYYSRTRCQDAHTINDLAMYNYLELKDLVNKSKYKLRKKFDLWLNKLFPNKWIPLYSMVTFTRIPYHQVVQLKANPEINYASTANPEINYASTANPEINYASTANPEINYASTANPEINYASTANPEINYASTANPEINYASTANLEINYASTANPEINYASTANPEINYASTANPEINYASTANPEINYASTANPEINYASTANPEINYASTANPEINYASTANPAINYASTANPEINYASTANPEINYASTANPEINYASTANPAINYASTANPEINYASTANPEINYASTANLNQLCFYS
uniref:Kynurenine 3-monooxygenase n=1 Tax=Ditylenchus dipsaci TaxID=166011 RepID=A0A915DSS7_9BILA